MALRVAASYEVGGKVPPVIESWRFGGCGILTPEWQQSAVGQVINLTGGAPEELGRLLGGQPRRDMLPLNQSGNNVQAV